MTRTTHPPYTGSLANVGQALDNLFATINKTGEVLRTAHAEIDAQDKRDAEIRTSDAERRDQTSTKGRSAQ